MLIYQIKGGGGIMNLSEKEIEIRLGLALPHCAKINIFVLVLNILFTPLKIGTAMAALTHNHCMVKKIPNNVVYCNSENAVMNFQP